MLVKAFSNYLQVKFGSRSKAAGFRMNPAAPAFPFSDFVLEIAQCEFKKILFISYHYFLNSL